MAKFRVVVEFETEEACEAALIEEYFEDVLVSVPFDDAPYPVIRVEAIPANPTPS